MCGIGPGATTAPAGTVASPVTSGPRLGRGAEATASRRTVTEYGRAMRPRLSLLLIGLAAAAPIVALGGCGSGGGSSPSATASTSAATLRGSSWLLASYTGATGPVDADPQAAAALQFRDAGALSGSTGCNSFSGTYVQDGSAVTVTLGPMTLMACVDPAVTAQEKAVVDGLGKVASFRGAPDGELTLLDRSGATLLTYRAGLSGLAGTSWRATGINNGKSAVEGTALSDKVTAAFAEGGTLTGSGGCNDYRGTWEATGTDRLAIGPLATTKKLCEPDVNALEQRYLTALAKVATYEITGTTLTLRDETGATQVTYRLGDG